MRPRSRRVSFACTTRARRDDRVSNTAPPRASWGKGEPMPKKYLCIQRSAPAAASPPSPAEMQEMWAAFNAWRETFEANLVDLGGKLAPTGKVVTSAGVSDGPFIESKELVGGFMIVSADDYAGAVAIVRAMPMLGGS